MSLFTFVNFNREKNSFNTNHSAWMGIVSTIFLSLSFFTRSQTQSPENHLVMSGESREKKTKRGREIKKIRRKELKKDI